MKVALVHDMLTQNGGAEKVFECFTELYPKAPIFTLLYNNKKMKNIFPPEKINTSFLQSCPFAVKKYKWYLPLMPQATESYDLNEFDLILSSSSAFAKGIIAPSNAVHICYCHTPTRYLWINSQNYINDLKYNKLIKKIINLNLTRLRIWDVLAAQRVDKFITNSKNVQKKIKKYYNRNSEIIYPPVETEKFYISEKKENYFLAGGRLVPYKRFDLVIEAFNRLNLPLKIFGSGPEFKTLKKKAKKNIEFLGFISDQDKAKLYSNALAFIHPQEEDFGIMLVEAMASGIPVIAYRGGGALESLLPQTTGEFFNRQTWEDLADKIIHFNPENYNPQTIRQQAEKFSVKNFKKKINAFIEKTLNKK